MPQYLLSVWHDDDYGDVDFSSDDMQRIVGQVDKVNAELQQTGARRASGPPVAAGGGRGVRS